MKLVLSLIAGLLIGALLGAGAVLIANYEPCNAVYVHPTSGVVECYASTPPKPCVLLGATANERLMCIDELEVRKSFQQQR